ncbi:MAG: DivIVA domain-containing protein [Clostridia bacterium]|nr:DivIVA domain-containing protein [Clostridia bacterium]
MSENGKRLTITDIETKNFRCEAYGYEQRDVDEFLDCICDEMEVLQGEIAELKQQLDYARAETRKAEAASGFVTPAASAPDQTFREILEMAQRVKDQTIADAQRRAEEIVADATAQAAATLGNLESERDRLQAIVTTLRSRAAGYRDAMFGLMAEHQVALEALKIGDEDDKPVWEMETEPAAQDGEEA